MIGFTLNEEHEALRATWRSSRHVVAPVIGGYYERGEFPYEIVARMGKLGLFGLPFPEEYGGMGGDYFALCLALHELARVDSSVAITLEAASRSARCRSSASAPTRRRRVAAGLFHGERCGLRPDRTGVGSERRRHGDHGRSSTADEWVIDGSKAFITNTGTR